MAATVKVHLKCSRKGCISKQVVTIGALAGTTKGKIIVGITQSGWRPLQYGSLVFCSVECKTKCLKIGARKL